MLVIAREPGSGESTAINLRSIEVSYPDRISFLKTGRTTTQRRVVRMMDNLPSGELWVPPLSAIWNYLKTASRLGEHFSIRQGLRWASTQDEAWSREPLAGHRSGLHSARGMRQFMLQPFVWLDCRAKRLLGRRIELAWELPKLVVNGARLTRGPWRIGAALDKDGLLCSQQFFALWPNETVTDTQLLAFSAILNGPVANAFLATHSPAKGIRISALERIPVPSALPPHTGDFVADYIQHLRETRLSGSTDERAEALLTRIDAAVLGAYDLPPRLERQLLDYFRGMERPVAHSWRHWDERDPTPGLTLAERVSRRFPPHGSSIREVFQPLPPDEAELLRAYGV